MGNDMNKSLKKFITSKYLVLFSRIVLGLIFVYSGINKIAYPGDFAWAVENYRILPLSLVNIFALIISWMEFLGGLFLILGVFTRGSSLVISGLLSIFIIAIVISLIRGLDIDCGCFLPWDESSKVGLRKLIEDIVMLAMGLHIFFFTQPFFSLECLLKKSRA